MAILYTTGRGKVITFDKGHTCNLFGFVNVIDADGIFGCKKLVEHFLQIPGRTVKAFILFEKPNNYPKKIIHFG